MERVLLFVLLSFSVHAVTVGIIDSGTDYKHEAFTGKIWINAKEISSNGQDDDRNGFTDDFYGWNFAENNSEVIDYSYLGTFSQTPYKFFEVQGRVITRTKTLEDETWLEQIKANPTAMREIATFANFVHGTHVADTAARAGEFPQVLSVKLLPTSVGMNKSIDIEAFKERAMAQEGPFGDGFDLDVFLAQMLLDMILNGQMKNLKEIGNYVGSHGAKVANGSFGVGDAQADAMARQLLGMFGGESDEAKVQKLKDHVFTRMDEFSQDMVQAAPDTLFVFAAGNDGLDNDETGSYPANVRAPNSMSVAATWGQSELASFSCYGKKMVEIAAPGVVIKAAIPGDEYLAMSGTSMAAPEVAGVAAQVRGINPKLTPKQVKQILMDTVDFKEFLADKIISGGILNGIRAQEAANLSLTMSIPNAVVRAREIIHDIAVEKENEIPEEWRLSSHPSKELIRKAVLPLPAPFTL